MNQTAPERRARAIQTVTEGSLDLLVVGGGIVGSGIARDAAMRGLRTALVEQHDLAFGTSSRSSRLLHGGMRYLAQGRVGLVREASKEKRILHTIAPHLADPLAFTFPSYGGDKEWALWKLKVGVKLYDLLCGGKNLGRSTWLSRAEALHHVPGLRADHLNGAVRYFDGLTNDARLVLDTLRSAAQHGAEVLNYVKFTNASREVGGWTFEVEDRLTGATKTGRARAVVNATGPWAQGIPHSRVKLRLTKGIHLVIDRARMPVPDAVVMTEGRRILFAIPWAGRVILGTTDTDYQGPLDAVHANAADIRYVLRVANRFFPNASLAVSDVVSSWAGLRPLIADPGGKPSEISREHQILSPEPGWWDVAGGKLTTYRLMAEQTVDKILQHLGRPASASQTAREPLLPESQTQGISGIAPPEFSREIVEHFCASEWAVNVEDVMIRRTGWHYYHRDAAEKAVKAAQWMGAILGWSAGEQENQLERYRMAAGHIQTGETRE